MSVIRLAAPFVVLWLVGFPAATYAQPDAESCKDHPLFTRLPNFHIADCESSQSELKRFPVGPLAKGQKAAAVEEVRGPYMRIHYRLNDGAAKPRASQVLGDFESAAKQGSAAVVMGEYPDKCKATLDESMYSGDSCINYGVTVKSALGGKEVWAFMQSTNDGAGYELRIVERDVRKPDAVANEMLEKIIKEGFVTLHINFDFNKASIKQDSIPLIVQIVEMLKLAPDLNIEVGGHTDNVGGAQSNQVLSEARAQSVVKTLIDCGVPASRLVAKGYGQSKPVVDNKTAEGRAKNRRVELRKI